MTSTRGSTRAACGDQSRVGQRPQALPDHRCRNTAVDSHREHIEGAGRPVRIDVGQVPAADREHERRPSNRLLETDLSGSQPVAGRWRPPRHRTRPTSARLPESGANPGPAPPTGHPAGGRRRHAGQHADSRRRPPSAQPTRAGLEHRQVTVVAQPRLAVHHHDPGLDVRNRRTPPVPSVRHSLMVRVFARPSRESTRSSGCPTPSLTTQGCAIPTGIRRPPAG